SLRCGRPLRRKLPPCPRWNASCRRLLRNDAVAAVLSDDVDDEEAAPSLEAAVKNKLEHGIVPGKGGTMQWKPFCDSVRNNVGAAYNQRGFGDRTIYRIVTRLRGGKVLD